MLDFEEADQKEFDEAVKVFETEFDEVFANLDDILENFAEKYGEVLLNIRKRDNIEAHQRLSSILEKGFVTSYLEQAMSFSLMKGMAFAEKQEKTTSFGESLKNCFEPVNLDDLSGERPGDLLEALHVLNHVAAYVVYVKGDDANPLVKSYFDQISQLSDEDYNNARAYYKIVAPLYERYLAEGYRAGKLQGNPFLNRP